MGNRDFLVIFDHRNDVNSSSQADIYKGQKKKGGGFVMQFVTNENPTQFHVSSSLFMN